MKTLRMKQDYHQRLLHGHLWAWRNDFDLIELERILPGEPIRVESSAGDLVGSGFANPLSHIAFRLMDRSGREPDEALIRHRLEHSLAWRSRVRPDTSVCRLVYGESDGLPGLIVDRYGPVLVISQSVAGMEPWTPFIVAELDRRLDPDIIILRNTNLLRRLEGLAIETRVIKGTWTAPVAVDYDGITVEADCLEGRKTGLFLDHRENRRRLRELIRGGEQVLDLYSHVGLWSLTALAAGAERAVLVDADSRAVAAGGRSAALNGWETRMEFHTSDVRAFLQDSPDAFDVVILDPPAFAKKKRYLKDALPTYVEHNILALKHLRSGGILVTSSCSSFVTADILGKICRQAAQVDGRPLQLVAEGTQALDHPILFGMPETRYLKCLFFRVL